MKAVKPSQLFAYIEQVQGQHPWGAFLDAGTGTHSIKWVSSLETDRWTAVTGAPGDEAQVRTATESMRRAQDKIVLGNWANPDLLKGEVFDTVLADYLLGAVEGFAPYYQPYLFARLRPLTQGRLYLTAPEPYVPTDHPKSESGKLIWQIGRFRDSCLLLAGDLPYREYPSAWVTDQLKRSGFAPRALKRFDIHYRAPFVNSQIDLCVARVKMLADPDLAQSLIQHGEVLRMQALELIESKGALVHGHNYVIAADPV